MNGRLLKVHVPQIIASRADIFRFKCKALEIIYLLKHTQLVHDLKAPLYSIK